MSENIVVVQQVDGDLWVDARTLHAKLESKQDFTNWVTKRLSVCGATEGRDFSIVLLRSVNNRATKDYLISLDLGKHFAMMERTEKGREVREYFIAAEKELRAASPVLPTLSPMEMLAQLAMGMVAAEKKLNTVMDKVDAAEAKTVALEQRLEDMPIDSEKRGRLHKLGQELGELISHRSAWGIFKRHFKLGVRTGVPHYNTV